MANPSLLRFVPASSATVPIDWEKIPDVSKDYFRNYLSWDWVADRPNTPPATIGDLAQILGNCKVFSYMEPKVIEFLLDIGKFGLTPQVENHIGVKPSAGSDYPRFYMKHLSEILFIIFTPGKIDSISGHIPTLLEHTSREDENQEFETDKTLAEAFDMELNKDIEQRKDFNMRFYSTEKLADWNTSMLTLNLEYLQYIEAIRTLPPDHPYYRALMQGTFR